MKKNEQTTYAVYHMGVQMSKCRTEAKAIQEAAGLGDNASVVRITTSGTYKSTQQVWPTVGDIYTN